MTPAPPGELGMVRAIAAIAAGTEPDDRIAEVHQAARARLARARDEVAAIESAMVDHILTTGRSIVIGETEYRAATKRDTKNRPEEKTRTLLSLFDACGGDLEAVAAVLCSDPYKPATARGLLPKDEYDACFETVEIGARSETW